MEHISHSKFKKIPSLSRRSGRGIGGFGFPPYKGGLGGLTFLKPPYLPLYKGDIWNYPLCIKGVRGILYSPLINLSRTLMREGARGIFKFFRKQEAGFTLVEILVSMFIIVTLTTLLLVNYHSTNSRAALITAAQKLASDIRLAQEYSLGSKEFNGQVPLGGWGVYFNTTTLNSYIIFADQNAPLGNRGYDTGEDFKIITLPQGITIDSLTAFDSVYHSVNPLPIVFFPPDPTTYINNDYIKAKITLKERTGNTTKTIEINSLGLVDVMD